MKRFLYCTAFAALLAASPTAQAQTTTFTVGATTVSVSPLATNLNVPWELVWGPDNFIWMTERNGRISRVNPDTGEVLPLLSVPDVRATGESGLLGMALHPDFATSPYLYIVYNYQQGNDLKEKLVRYTYAASTRTLSSPLVLLDNITANTTHSGSRLLILPDRTLLMTTGDAQVRPEAQNPTSLNGKILRLNLDGTVPSNNPTPGSLVYTLGHRNPQGLVRASNGKIYSSEHGQDQDDEVNLIEAGRNYGWPNIEGRCDLTTEQAFCAANNVREPLRTWTPTLATAGLIHYDHPAIPEWRNSLLMVTLKAAKLVQMPLVSTTEDIGTDNSYLTTFGRLRAICVSPQGKIYISTSNRDGRGAPAATDDRILLLENRAYLPAATASAAKAAKLSVWPNPAQGSVTLRLPTAATAPGQATVLDALGRVARTMSFGAGQADMQLNIAGLTPGIYAVRARSGNALYTQQLVVR
ncbi:PQQ-dependent sugar dehydrogenase [Hymenobacter chitinivorans]|uniref:PQQ-dependent dehydrogenase (S-GDH family) n=1 Tax=Hymenobacter chitinivorans DSM 11115 TaxID=1121954 RepID=A0A2M9B9E7_9BACT|nr:PQQ-dependent sugar dehydrogenase [Hymenobacter chitinivorans]PJJ54563.1 PQQ-dependent dehydrogenase (s-GDH family) [Hymenobacter chitinivorans DSM 11115]